VGQPALGGELRGDLDAEDIDLALHLWVKQHPDGRFEVITLPHTAKWRILGVALRAATTGLGPQPSAAHYDFTTLKPTPLQLDGEVLAVEAGTAVCVEVAPRALATIS
jgi:hypothetical protein